MKSHDKDQDRAPIETARQSARERAPLGLAAQFLAKPRANAWQHSISAFLAKLPFLPPRRRAKFAYSAAKRDFDALAARLLDISANGVSESGAAVDFDGFRGRSRRGVLGAEWHKAFVAALQDTGRDIYPEITVSLVTYNSEKWLDGFFASLLAQAYPLDKINLIVVDNGSTDGTLDALASWLDGNKARFASADLVRQSNVGFGMGHDVALRQSTDAYVLVTNVDLVLPQDALTTLVRAAEADREDVASWEMRQSPYEHPKYYDPVTLETSWSSHACILIRRSAYIDVGGYEERIFMYGEDVELSYRFRGAGYVTRYVPQAAVTHFVDFEDAGERPSQFAGSVAANVLLRHRYGDAATVADGMQNLSNLVATTQNAQRCAALETAQTQIAKDAGHFASTKLPTVPAHFPFNGFDYDVTRQGHAVVLDNAEIVDPPLVSVITRTHGPNTRLLEEALLSVGHQTYSNIEHIIVEDRTDYAEATVKRAQYLARPSLRYLKSGGAGRSAAGNAGLAAATGTYALFLDNDDLLFADHIEILVRSLLNTANAPAAYALSWEVPTFYDQGGNYREAAPVSKLGQSRKFSAKALQKQNFLPIQSVLFKRELFNRFGGFDEDIDFLEDWNLWYRYAQAGDFLHVAKTTSMYRVPGDQVFRAARESGMEDARAQVRRANEKVASEGQPHK
ncbi:MAG: glycosyltransferase family 2 protein [Rhodobacteraceae bacterium]|nr:glycosyltransferase family 2 protein [Paracoccaceae bacterium]